MKTTVAIFLSTRSQLRHTHVLGTAILSSILFLLLGAGFCAPPVWGATTITINTTAAGRQQLIDGFGTFTFTDTSLNNLYLNDMGCSMVRVDLSPN